MATLLLDEITFQTNIYNIQHSTTGYKVRVKKRRTSDISSKKVTNITKSEIKKLIGIILYMGVHLLPNRRHYWGNKIRVSFIADAMTRNRFEEILSVLHFNNNEQMQTDKNAPNYDYCAKSCH